MFRGESSRMASGCGCPGRYPTLVEGRPGRDDAASSLGRRGYPAPQGPRRYAEPVFQPQAMWAGVGSGVHRSLGGMGKRIRRRRNSLPVMNQSRSCSTGKQVCPWHPRWRAFL